MLDCVRLRKRCKMTYRSTCHFASDIPIERARHDRSCNQHDEVNERHKLLLLTSSTSHSDHPYRPFRSQQPHPHTHIRKTCLSRSNPPIPCIREPRCPRSGTASTSRNATSASNPSSRPSKSGTGTSIALSIMPTRIVSLTRAGGRVSRAGRDVSDTARPP